MAQRTIARMYDSYDEAKTVVHELETSGVPHSEISLVANADAHGRSATTSATGAGAADAVDPADRTDTDSGAGGKRGAVLGTVLGGGVGLLAGIGALAIPGVGPVVAAGWLVATLTGAGVGAASGGLVGGLTGAGMSHDEANVYAEGVKRGGSLVTVRVDDTQTSSVEALMAKHGGTDWQQRRSSYGSDWSGFNASPTAPSTGTAATGTTGVSPSASIPGEAGSGLASGTDPNRRL